MTMIRKTLISTLMFAALASPVWPQDDMAIGAPADAATATRTVDVAMAETADGKMVFTPTTLTFKQGETVRLALHNTGEQVHEFVMDTPEGITAHKAEMAEMADMPDMMHSDPNALRLEPGARGEITWTFANAGTFEFACLIPGHYEAGMHGALTVN
jgi:uncharacterized cupredoxin-like copper-binding protein